MESVSQYGVPLKLCKKCKVSKPLCVFRSNSRKPDGRDIYCRQCRAAQQRNWRKKYPEKNRAAQLRLNERRNSRRANDSEYRKAYNEARRLQYHALSPEEKKRRGKHNHLKGYGLTPEQYHELLRSQNFCCAICQTPLKQIDRGWGKGRKHHIDHDHETGKVRGVLCSTCNVGIGHLGDSIEGLERALKYLRGH